MARPQENSEAPAAALEVRGLGKSFPGVSALDDVSLRLEPGQVHGLVGQNGAGKSTLINILSGMLAADAGDILIGGRPAPIAGPRDAQRRGIATVYQELSLLPNLTVEQNIVLGREPRRRGLLDVRAMRAEAEAVLARLDLAVAPQARVGNLSLAERQMVEIAKALAIAPRILVLDEPTAPLGHAESEQLFAAIGRLARDGVAILYVSHRFAEVLRLCDVATVLRNGRHVVTTDLSGWTEAQLTEAMIGRAAETFRAGARARGEPAVSAEGLGWGPRLRDVSLAVGRGEIVALTGLLGAGQNEIARLVGGDIRAERGRILVGGRPARIGSPGDAVRAGISLLTEDRKQEGILPNRPLRENIAVGSLGRRSGALGIVDAARERAETAAAAKAFAVVAASIEAPIRTLSGGNQQKALLARWDLADAAVFVLVEPTRGVDVGARADIYNRLDALARAGKAILIVSSDLPEVLAIADRILVVHDGRIVAEALPAGHDEESLNLLVQGAAA